MAILLLFLPQNTLTLGQKSPPVDGLQRAQGHLKLHVKFKFNMHFSGESFLNILQIL